MSNAILASSSRSFNGSVNRIAAHLPAIHSVEPDDKAFVSISTAAKAIGMSPQFLRLAELQGRVTSLRTVGGNHRRYSIAKLKSELFGLAEETVNDERRKVAVYGRVSSVSQKEALKTQIDDTIKRAAELEKVEPATIAVYREICSSFKDRPELNRLIDDIIANKLSRIYIAYRDRLSRTPALTSVILHLCEKHGVKIVYLYTETPKSDIEELTSELVEFVTLIGNRQAAAKSKKVTQKNIPLETLRYCFKLFNQGNPCKIQIS
jgi:predicted site-specific integrase-resolvase